MNFDDPKLTAYALDELDETERSKIARAIAESPEAQRFIADTQMLARTLKSGFGHELERETNARRKLGAVQEEAFWSKAGPLAIAALLAVLAAISAVALSGHRSAIHGPSESALSPELAGARAERQEFAAVQGEDASQNQSAEADAGPYAFTGERPFVSVVSKPYSSVPLLVNSVSYLDVQRSINGGVLPTRDAVRVEGMINHFSYDYPPPTGAELFSIHTDVVSCPWETSHRLVRIGLRGREAIAVGEASGIEVEFNPRYVAAYRLIGYDRKGSERRNLNQVTEGSEQIPTGYSLTVLYEVIVPASRRPAAAAPGADGLAAPTEPLLSVKLRLTTPTHGGFTSVERVVRDDASAFAAAPEDLKFAAAVAEFGMILRDSEYKGNGTFENVMQWAVEGKGTDRGGARADFIELVRKAQALTKS